MVYVNGILVVYLRKIIPEVRIHTKDKYSQAKSILWPPGKPLTPETIKVEVAKQWKVEPNQVVILDNVEVPKI